MASPVHVLVQKSYETSVLSTLANSHGDRIKDEELQRSAMLSVSLRTGLDKERVREILSEAYNEEFDQYR
jgi:hypothetical protein